MGVREDGKAGRQKGGKERYTVASVVELVVFSSLIPRTLLLHKPVLLLLEPTKVADEDGGFARSPFGFL